MRDEIRSLAFVIPAHNEEACIREVCRQAIAEIERLTLDGQVIVIDDASTDRTLSIVEELCAADSRITVLREANNVGAQRCIMRGMLASTSDASMLIPGDLQVRADEAGHCLERLAHADVVCTRRTTRAEGFVRDAMSRTFNRAVSWAIRLPFSDADSAFLLRRDTAQSLVPQLKSRGDFLQAELLARAVAAGLTVVEEPIAHYERPGGKSTALAPFLVAKTLFDFSRLALHLRRTVKRAPAIAGR